MAASTSPTTILVPRILSPKSILRPKATITAFAKPNINRTPPVNRRTSLVPATKPKKETANSSTTSNEPDPAFISQEDVIYLIKVGAGSVVGAAAIKYGSIIFPEITTPNLIQAMTMIFAPVIVAVLLLIKQSSGD